MITELTYNDLETIQGGVSCIMPRTNNKAGGSYDPFIDGRVSPPRYRSGEAYPMVYLLSVFLCRKLKSRFLFDNDY